MTDPPRLGGELLHPLLRAVARHWDEIRALASGQQWEQIRAAVAGTAEPDPREALALLADLLWEILPSDHEICEIMRTAVMHGTEVDAATADLEMLEQLRRLSELVQPAESAWRHPSEGPNASDSWTSSPGIGPSSGAQDVPVLDPEHGRREPERFLRGQCPENVRIGVPFSVLARIDQQGAHPPLRTFPVGPEGADVVLVMEAPGLHLLSSNRQVVRVPLDGNSEPVMFEVQASEPGPYRLSISAWDKGAYLGDLTVETTASPDPIDHGWQGQFDSAIEAGGVRGAVSLVVRYDPVQNAYRFEFRDEDNPAEVVSNLAYDPGPRVEQLVSGLDRVAKGRAGYSGGETRDYLMNAGVGLWRELIPAQLREQFWERQGRIRQLTILADSDTVPWELLYPLDPGHDAGFLVEQFPVTRIMFGRRPVRSLSLSPARFVLPEDSPPQALEEVNALLQLLQPLLAPEPVIRALTPLLDLIRAGNFGLLHFACHNAFDPANGSAISLDRRQLTPMQLNAAAVGQVLAGHAPTVFINACRSAGVSPSYHRLDGWARKFMEAGAAAFIGSLWAVRDSSARDFASEMYQRLRAGTPLGEAVMRARQAAVGESGDPTWLAYAVYGDPRATVR